MTTTLDATLPARGWKYWTVPDLVTVDGLETAYRRSGPGETVVYLHGAGNTRAWLPFHAALAAGHDVIAPEHPGYGDTGRPPHFDSWEDWILHYDGFFRALGLGRFHLVGNSLGGMLAAKLAITYPERFKSVTLVNPLGLRLPGEPLRNLYRWDENETDEAYFNGRRDRYTDLLVQEGTPDDDVQAYKEATSTALLYWNPRYDRKLDQRLPRVTAPFLSIGVDDDRVIGNAMARRYAELVPNGRYTRVRGRAGEPSSHMVFLEQPEDTAAAIAEHIRASS